MSSKDPVKLKAIDDAELNQLYESAWMGFDTEKIKIPDELQHIIHGDEHRGLALARYLRKPENFGFLCSYIFNIKLMPFQLAILKEMWTHPFPMLIATRGGAKSFTLSLYAMIKCFLKPDHKVVIAGAGFRQSKHLFEYTKAIWSRAPVLRSLCRGTGSDHQGPHRDIDRCTMQICDSRITFLPIGTGGTIRGERAHTLIVDEFSVLPLEIFEVVLKGFTSTSPDPVQAAIQERMNELMEEKYGIVIEKDRTNINQSIISGTCDYDFQHFANYWRRYKQIIESKGDPNILQALNLDENIDYKHYSIMRIPYNLIPKGFMDASAISSAKATMMSSSFMMEYACLAPETHIITDKGAKFIKDIAVGDMVLTHKGRFKPVITTMRRYIENERIYNIRGWGYANDILITKEHPVYQSNNRWELLENCDRLYLSNLQELSNRAQITVSDFAKDFILKTIDDIEYISPKTSQLKISSDDIKFIADNEGVISAKELANTMGCSLNPIYYIWKNKNRFSNKYLIKNNISLTYDFGLIIGYYLSEGSIGSKGRSVSFALDGHVNVRLETYIKKLCDAIYTTFDIKPKLYFKKDNTINVTINNRLIADLIKSIVPGISHTKMILPDILYSNIDFLRGIIEGYWDGDGHWTNERVFCSASSASLSLITQIKIALSFFGITSSIHIRPAAINKIVGRYHNCKAAYILCIYGYDAHLFKNIFYGVPITYITDYSRQHTIKTYNNSIESVYDIKVKELIPYTGYVYNFEVEEDNSYSLLGGTVHNCIFSKDSEGFFKRSLIDSCVVTPKAAEGAFPSGADVFEARIVGNPERKYVYGIDPASESDNFSIVVLELHQSHSRIVYCWTTSKKDHKAELRAKLTKEQNFYAYVVRKVRQLMKTFPPVKIGCDSQGGGVGVREAFHDQAHIKDGELPIFPVMSDDPKKPNDTDMRAGLHIVEYVNFAKADWVTEANHGLRKDFEDKVLLFPYFDTASLELAAIEDDQLEKEGKLTYDSLESCIWEIEELKSELATIVETKTAAQARSRWDTPEVKLPNSRKGRLKKDRYSALLIANMVARQIHRTEVKPEYQPVGGFTNTLAGKEDRGALMYTGPENWVRGIQNFYS